MSVLLAPDVVEVWGANTTVDGHGWAVPSPSGAWSGRGNVQEDPPTAAAGASEGGGAGPYRPREVAGANVYLPVDCPVEPGDVLRARGREWVAQTVQHIIDPLFGGVECLVVRATRRAEVAG